MYGLAQIISKTFNRPSSYKLIWSVESHHLVSQHSWRQRRLRILVNMVSAPGAQWNLALAAYEFATLTISMRAPTVFWAAKHTHILGIERHIEKPIVELDKVTAKIIKASRVDSVSREVRLESKQLLCAFKATSLEYFPGLAPLYEGNARGPCKGGRKRT